MEKRGGHQFFFGVFVLALSSSASLVETSHVQYPSSLLLIPHCTVLKQRQNHRG